MCAYPAIVDLFKHPRNVLSRMRGRSELGNIDLSKLPYSCITIYESLLA